MHGKRRRKSSCAPFKHNHTIKEAYEDTRPTGDKINIPLQLEYLEVPKYEPLEYLEIPELKQFKPLDVVPPPVKQAEPPLRTIKLEAKPIQQTLSTRSPQELKTGGASILDSLPKKRFENKPMYTMTDSGFQIQTSTAIWDEDSKRFKMRPMEPEEIQYQEDQIKKHIENKKKGKNQQYLPLYGQ